MLNKLSFGQLMVLLIATFTLVVILIAYEVAEEAYMTATLEETTLKYDNTLELLNASDEALRASESANYELKSHMDELEHENYDLKVQIEEMKLEIDEIMQEYEQYKTEVESYPSSRGEFNRDDLSVLYRIVEAECTGQSFEAKVNVAHVILNRVFSDDFPNTISGVVFQPRQFSPIADSRYYQVVITEETIKAVEHALNSVDTTDGSLFFLNKSISDADNTSWFERSLEYVMSDDSGHSFYRKKESP